jgi:hypothetical protein
MFSTPFTFFAPPTDGFDPDYQEVLNYATSQGWALPSSTNQTKDNTLVLALKAAGIWTKLDVFYMFSTDFIDFARINWITPGSHTATLAGTIVPVFTSNSGFTGNAANSAFINTNFNPSTSGVNFTQNDASRHFWKGNTAAGFMDGNILTGNLQAIQTGNSANQRLNNSAQINTAYSYAATVGLKSIHRTSSTNLTLITNTTSATRTATSIALSNSNQLLFRSVNTYTAHLARAYSMGASLVSENTDYYNALNTRLS